ncbi:MAG: hypothetical protein J4473_03970 [Candidatus Aenigmarchaeota archaeon]|nr:hypothetical protein [Candidatus Aenigmarchaeota archaeon]
MQLVKCGELYLKSNYVRHQFTERLRTNIVDYYKKCGCDVKVRKINSSVFLIDSEKNFLKFIFGIEKHSNVTVCEKNISSIKNCAEKLAKNWKKKTTFAVFTKRTDKNFKMNSPEVSKYIGSVLYKKGYKVDLKNPKNKIYIEIRDAVYVYTKFEKGLGGLPYGVSGNACSKINSIEDVIACYLMMKRGMRLFYLQGSKKTHVKYLEKFCPQEIKKMIYRNAKRKTLFLVSGSPKISKKEGDLILVYPLVGMKKKEISNLKRKLYF